MPLTLVIVLVVSAFLFDSTRALSAVVAQYGMSSAVVTTKDTNVTASNLIPNTNLPNVTFNRTDAAYINPGVPYGAFGHFPSTTNIATAIANGSYVSFTVTPMSGFELDCTTLQFSASRGGESTPRGWAVRTSIDNFATTIASATLNQARPTWSTPNPFSINLSGAAFQNLGGSITFRIYTWGPANTNIVDFKNISLNGIVSATTINTDKDGVHMLFPTDSSKPFIYISDIPNINNSPNFDNEYNHQFTNMTEGGVTFWRSTGNLTGGSPSLRTHRFWLFPFRTTQVCMWSTCAPSNHYLSDPNDITSYEATLYWRFNTPISGTQSKNGRLYIRRGYSASFPEGASLPSSRNSAIPMKIMTPPAANGPLGQICKIYTADNRCSTSGLQQLTSYNTPANTWLAVKVVSWLINNNSAAHYEVWIDRVPWVSGMTPRNQWEKWLVWDDDASKVSAFGGWPPGNWGSVALELRVDQYASVDVAIMSARSIVPQ